ncbi:T9SS type A sorting domain-containing protein [Flavobacteriaceae bacterium SZ-1-7]|uniref:T9SS type A sorting domain-containing protein n=1 Tax=Tamlana sedimenti TaxID=3134126 RepID=UPI0031217537
MKKQITFLLFTLLFALASSHVMAQQNVLYILQDGTNDEGNGSSLPGNDPITRMLEADANFTVSWVKIANADFTVTEMGTQAAGSNAVSSPVSLTGFDLVIASESLASSNAAFKAGNPLHPDQITAPVIYGKSYAFRGSSTALVTSATADVTRTQELSMTVVNGASPLFNGIDTSGGTVEFLRTTSDDKGNVGPYACDVVHDIEISSATTLVASVPQLTDNATSVGINYFPSGTQVGTTADGTFAQDAIAFPFNFGTIRKMDGGNVTSEFLTIWRNAAYMLTGQTVPATLYVNPDYDKYEIIEETTVYDFRDGSIIPDNSEGYVIQGSPEALAAPQTDRLKSADGRLDYRHAPNDNFHSTQYGLDMKNGSRVLLKPLGTAVVKVPLSEYSSLDFDFKMANNNSKSWIKVNGNSQTTNPYQEVLDATATSGQDLNEFITIEFFATVGNSQNLEFLASDVNGGSDIYLPYMEVTYQILRKKPVKILYLNNANTNDEGGQASVPGNDAITRMLNADENFEVTAGTIDGVGAISPADLSPFNLIIIQESVSSGSNAMKPDLGPLALKSITVPVIYCKSEAFRDGRAITDVTAPVAGIANVKTSISVTVDPANQGNPLFSGIDFSGGNDVRLFKSGAADNGTAGTTGLKVLNNLDISNVAGGTLATTPEVIDPASSIVINHIPANTQLGENAADQAPVDIVAFAFGYGAQVRGDGANISPEALTIWRNAVYMLSGLTVPTTLVENPDYFLPKEIAYVQLSGYSTAAGASTTTNDPITRMFDADDKFNITVIETDAAGTGLDLAGYDLVIAQETFGSGNGIWKPTGPLGVKNVSVPVIYNKTWAFRNNLAITDADAAVSGTQNVSVTATNTAHPLFKGIDFSGGNDIRIFAEATADNDGSVGGNKAIDILNNLEISSPAAASIATVPEVTDAAKAFVINFIPSGTQLGEDTNDVLQVNAVALSFAYGAMIMGDGANISPEALTIWRNAAYMLTWGAGEIPDTLVANPDFTLSIDKAGEVSNVSSNVRAIGNRIYVSDVKSSTEINIYSISGALVKSFKTNSDVDFNFNTGLWIATVKTYEGAKAVKLLVK